MPKWTEVIKKIEKAAKAKGIEFQFKRPGGNHDVYSLDGLLVPIGRHRELDHGYAEMVYKECEPKLGRRWWR